MPSDVSLHDGYVKVDGNLHAPAITTSIVAGNFLGRRSILINADEVIMGGAKDDKTPVNRALTNSDEYLVLNHQSGFTNGVRVEGNLHLDGELRISPPHATKFDPLVVDLVELVFSLQKRVEVLEAHSS